LPAIHCDDDAEPELESLAEERNRMTERIDSLTPNRDAIASYLNAVNEPPHRGAPASLRRCVCVFAVPLSVLSGGSDSLERVPVVDDRTGPSDAADFEQIERHQRAGRWDVVGGLLAEQGNKLKAAGADFLLLACNTVHISADRIESAVDLRFLHRDPTARKVQQGGVTTVGLLGSRYTMTGGYFVGRLRERHGLNVLVAEGEHQDNLHGALYAELVKAMFLPATREKFKAAIADLVQRGAQAVILGRTEFGMLLDAGDSTVPLIDTTLAHAEAAVDMAHEGQH
jgi:aspartate racemase